MGLRELQSQPTACVRALRHTPYRRVQRSSEKTLAAFVPSALRCRLPEKFLLLIFRAFFFRRPATPESAATRSLPCGGGLGRGHSPSCGNLSQHLNLPNTSLAACCPLSNSLPRGERTGWLLGLKVLQGKQVVRAAFCFSDDLKSTAVNPSCFSNCLQPQNLLQSALSPVGEGWGEGISRIAAIFPNNLTAPIQALRLVALSLALSHGREDGRLLGLRVLQGKQVVRAAFCFSDDLHQRL